MSTGLGPSLRRGLALLFLLALWESLSRVGWVDPFYAPPPSQVSLVLLSLFADGEIWTHLAGMPRRNRPRLTPIICFWSSTRAPPLAE